MREFLIALVIFKFGAMPLLCKGVMFNVRFIVCLELKGG